MPLQAGQAFIELNPRLSPDFAAKTAAGIEAATTPLIERVQKKFESIGGSLRNTGRKLSTFVTLPLVGAGVIATNFASDVAESLSKARVVFGPLSKTIEDFAANAATNLGISRGEALEAAGTFGNLFTAMKIGLPDAAKMSTGILQLSADLASFNNASPEDVLLALRSGLVGETEPLRKFGINLSAARIEAKALELGLASNKDELTAGAKAQAAYALIMDDTKTAQGDFARTADGAANSQRILAAQAKDLAAELGARLLPIGIKVLGFARGLIDRFRTLSPTFKTIIFGVVGLAAAAGPLVYIFGALATVIGFILSPIGLVIAGIAAVAAVAVIAYRKFEPFRNVVDTVARFFTERLVPAVKSLVNAFSSGGLSGLLDELKRRFAALSTPIKVILVVLAGLAAAAISPFLAIGAALFVLYKKFEPFRRLVDTVVDAFKNFASRIGDRLKGLGEAFRNIFKIIVGIVGAGVAIIVGLWHAIGDDIIRVVKAAFRLVANVVKAAFDIIIGIVDVFIGIFTLDFGRVWEGLSGIVGGAFDAVVAVLEFAWETIKSTIGAALSIIGGLFSEGWNFLVGIVSGVFDAIVGFVLGLGGRILAPFAAVWTKLAGFALEAVTGIVNFVTGLPGKLLGLVGSIGEAAAGIGRSIIDGIGRGLSAVAGFVGDLAGAVGSAFKKAANWVIQKLNDAIPDKLGFGPFSIDLPDNPIPHFATGGIVPGAPNQASLAVLHGQEAVFNRDQLAALGRVISAGGGGRGGVVHYAPTFVLGDRRTDRRELDDIDAATLRGLRAALRTV